MMSKKHTPQSEAAAEAKPVEAPSGIAPFDAQRFEELAKLLGILPEWTLGYGEADPAHDSSAYTLYEDDYHQAFITPGAGWPDSPAEQEQVMLHELSHLLLADLVTVSANVVDILPKQSAKLAEAILDREEELLCDRLSHIFIALLARSGQSATIVHPVPPIVEPKTKKLRPTRVAEPKPGEDE